MTLHIKGSILDLKIILKDMYFVTFTFITFSCSFTGAGTVHIIQYSREHSA